MDALFFQKVKSIFAAALEQNAKARAAFVREKCGGDLDLLAEIESLLAAHEEPENLIEANAFSLGDAGASSAENYYGREFGHYKILGEIGRGGMGAVFLAERADGEFSQEVALKIVRQTIVSQELERHFRRERQILASLNHPHIGRLLDGGVSAAGEPYLVMEYVEGENLLEFAAPLSLTEKLKLFLKICGAVEFAHRNLVVHRDIKPSNILVTKDGEPKLLDFGLAKIEDESFSADATQTAFRALTPAYASPEQLRGSRVSTASDIYSLGVVLYELLSGEKPFHFENKSLEEILQTISNEEPVPPSAITNYELRITNSKSKDSDSNQKSKIKNQKSLKGDLDNIVLTALRKEPERRYKSVAAFADDIEKYLSGLPIAARPNTFSYRAAKFYGRNKIAAAAAALILLTAIVGGIISFVQFRRAQIEKAKAEEVSAFLQKMMLTANPADNKGYSATINDMLEQAARRLENDDFSKQPEVKAELQKIIGRIYLGQGQYELGEKYLREALKTEIEIYGEAHPKVLKTKLALGEIYLSKANYDEAEKIFETNLPALREQCSQGNIESNELSAVLNSYALIRRARGDSKQAEALYRESLSLISQNESMAASQNFTRTMITLTQFDQGKFDEAETEARKLVAESSQNVNSLGVANTLTLLGSILMEKGNLKEAAENLQAAEKIYRRLLSPNAIAVYDNLRLQSQVSYLAGNYAEAEEQVNQVLENYRQNSSPKYISYATALTLQGLILNKTGRGAAAETVLREAVRLRAENLPAKHFLTALTKSALGEVLTANNKFDEAESLLRESEEDLKILQATENQRVLSAENRLAELYKVWNKAALPTK
ncbi:MAG TPA: protein kinase [Pyrinomonadaceae bacterium]